MARLKYLPVRLKALTQSFLQEAPEYKQAIGAAQKHFAPGTPATGKRGGIL